MCAPELSCTGIAGPQVQFLSEGLYSCIYYIVAFLVGSKIVYNLPFKTVPTTKNLSDRLLFTLSINPAFLCSSDFDFILVFPDFNARISMLFYPDISPRNFAIIAEKSK
jgi:hypothetical protein